MIRVLMVCTGNICRSTMAHEVFAEAIADAGLDGRIEVDSAGVSNEEEGNPIDRRAARVLRENGHAVPDHRARQVRAGELGEWDLVLAMTRGHLASLERLAEQARLDAHARPEIRLFREFDPQAGPRDMDLPDPWYGGYSDFVETLEVIERTTPAILEHAKRL